MASSSNHSNSNLSSTSNGKRIVTVDTKFKDMPRYFADITLGMIDDLLNPSSKPLSGNSQNSIKFLPPSATGGMGFIEKDEEDEQVDPYYVPFRLAPKRDTSGFDYVKQYRDGDSDGDDADSDDTLADDFDARTSIADANNNTVNRTHSVVGSRMSQVESVTTFNPSSTSVYNASLMQFKQKMDNIAEETGGGGGVSNVNLTPYDNTHIYAEYKTLNGFKYDESLPIYKCRSDILKLIESWGTCIIQGSTGCGKTTQVPQYLFDEHMNANKYCNIICTQPRRIAAVSVASRVCAERNWTLGTVCGYQIGLDRSKIGPDTRISYVTTGILLQKLIANDISKYTHIIIDEVHERNLDVDFVLLVLKILIKRKNLRIKLILMSATIDCELFSHYYQVTSSIKAPVFNIDGVNYHVEVNYLDDMKDFMANIEVPELKEEEPKFDDKLMMNVIDLLKYFDRIELNEIELSNDSKIRIINGVPETRGSVLIFVPGMNEIQRLDKAIRDNLPNSNLDILPLHSDIVIDQQKRVFHPQRSTRRKVIISTSIAESSITVPDIKYVIDFCLTKELWCDPYTNYTHLRVEWASKSSIDQRKGRAGRVSNGTCYRLITQAFRHRLSQESLPEILRVPLTKLILNVKRLKQGEPKRILSLALTPPVLDDIERTILLLKEAGALTITTENGFVNPNDGELTYAGQIMATLPIDIKHSKLILLGHAFGKLSECIIIAAAFSTKTFFTRYFNSNLEAYKAKWYWSQGTFCDAISIVNAFQVWEDYKTKGKFTCREDMRDWARANFIDLYRIQEVATLRDELQSRLNEFKIYTSEQDENNYDILDNRSRQRESSSRTLTHNANPSVDVESEDEAIRKNNLILKVLLCGAYYPNYFQADPIDENDAYRLVSGKDIKRTVMVKGLPINEGILYHDKLKKLFDACANQVQMYYEDSRAYIEFRNLASDDHKARTALSTAVDQENSIKTVVNLGVYLAVQMRLLRLPLLIEKYNEKFSRERLSAFNRTRQLERTQSIILNKTTSTIQLSESRLDLNATGDLHHNTSIDEYGTADESYTDTDSHTLARHSSGRCMATSMSQLRSSIITPCANKIVEYLNNPEYLIKNLREFPITVTDIVEYGHFWAHINEPSFKNVLHFIQTELNSKKHTLRAVHPNEIQMDMLVVSEYHDVIYDQSILFYRAKVIKINRRNHKIESVVVKFIDFGNDEEKSLNKLWHLHDSLQLYPFQAIECHVAKIKRSYLKCLNSGTVWPRKATDQFHSYMYNQVNLYAKVYSIIDNCVRVEVFYERPDYTGPSTHFDKRYVNIVDDLVQMGYVERCEETPMSRSSNFMLCESNYYVPRSGLHDNPRGGGGGSGASQASLLANQQNEFVFRTDDSLVCVPDTLYDLNSNTNNNNNSSNQNGGIYSGTHLRLNGPYSPLEMKFSSVVTIGRTKSSFIERDSINYVTLDDDIQTRCDRLLVAAEVTLNASANRMILRKTSLMPKIRGLSSIITLLFTPTCEVRLSDDKKSFTGALCGLGYDKHTRRPLYCDNDIECTFDVKIDFEEFKLINAVRMGINLIIGSEENALDWTSDSRNLRKLQQKACSKLLLLIDQERQPMEKRYFARPGRWNQIPETQTINLENEIKFENTFFTCHNVASLT